LGNSSEPGLKNGHEIFVLGFVVDYKRSVVVLLKLAPDPDMS